MKYRQFLTEATFAHVRRVLTGDVPAVDGIGILTSRHPASTPPNVERSRWLLNELLAGGYGPLKVQRGIDSHIEVSCVARNISREEVAKLGNHYKQDVVIWGQKKSDKKGTVFLDWECIDDRQATHRRLDLVSLDVEVKAPATAAEASAGVSIANRSFYVPYFDDERPLVEGRGQLTYVSSELPMHRQDVRQLVEKVQHCQEQLRVSGKIGRYYWQWRGILSETLADLETVLRQ